MGRRRLSQPDAPEKKTSNNYQRYALAGSAVIAVLAFLWQYRAAQLAWISHRLLALIVSISTNRATIRSETNLTIDDLLRYGNMSIEDTTKHFPGDTLGFVTPWNGKGYDLGRKFAPKFTMISPVWYQLSPGAVLSGSHDVDEEWMQSLRQNHVKIQIVPRVNLEGWSGQHLLELLHDPRPYIEVIVKEVQKRGYDGIVLEATQAMLFADYLSARVTEISIPPFSESVIVELGKRLASIQKRLLMVASPDPDISKDQAMIAYGQYVSHIVVMTYDHSSRGRVGPNAPFDWVRKTIQRIRDLPGLRPDQILLGLNFYGLDHTGPVGEPVSRASHPIVSHELIQLLTTKTIEDISYLESDREHLVRYRDENGDLHSVFYPTIRSIRERVALARELNVGLQIWEIGQGFDCFFDPL